VNAPRPVHLALCCLAAALLVVGCGSSKSSSSSKTSSTTPTTASTTATPASKAIASPFPKPHVTAHPGVKVDHLIIKDVVKGSGTEIHAGDSGQFDFIGSIYNTGKALDASWGKAKPLSLVIDHGSVIDGWWQGIPGMRVGGRRVLVIPAGLGFTQNMNSSVNNKATYFDVVLRGVIPAKPPGTGQSTTSTTGQ
jgi:FKBP-type peptidyl-prolyl cis-trans isomerase